MKEFRKLRFDMRVCRQFRKRKKNCSCCGKRFNNWRLEVNKQFTMSHLSSMEFSRVFILLCFKSQLESRCATLFPYTAFFLLERIFDKQRFKFSYIFSSAAAENFQMFYGKDLVSVLQGCIRVNTNLNDSGRIKKNLSSKIMWTDQVKGIDVWSNL